VLEEKEKLPMMDDILPLIVIAVLGLLQQRFMWFFLAMIFAEMALNRQ